MSKVYVIEKADGFAEITIRDKDELEKFEDCYEKFSEAKKEAISYSKDVISLLNDKLKVLRKLRKKDVIE